MQYIKIIKGHDDFYLALIEHRTELILDIARRNQARVARDLEITQTQLSHITQILKRLPDVPTIPNH